MESNDLEIDISSDNKIRIRVTLDVSKNTVWTYLTEPHLMRLWLGNSVNATPSGFNIIISLPLHDIHLQCRIREKSPESYFSFTWNSEFVMDDSLVVYKIGENEEGKTSVEITEIGPFSDSRWSDPKSIHADLWKTALQRLKKAVL